jgi:hypothetical protein
MSESLGIYTFREVGSMKSLRLLALALFAFACTATAAHACDAEKSAKTAKAGSTTTTNAVVASTNGGKVGAGAGCCAQATSAKTATAASSTGKSAAGCSAEMAAACANNPAVAAAMGCSNAKGTSAVTANNTGKASGCATHGSTATAGYDHCGGAKGAANTAVVAGLRCAEHQNGVAHDCNACDDWMQMDKDARSIGARSQVVALKNGAMIVYTADSPAQVKQLQAMIAKRNEHMSSAYAGANDTKLCDDCKQLRGAIASGKLHREVVNVERGVMALVTSNDHAVVQRIRNMTGQPLAMR